MTCCAWSFNMTEVCKGGKTDTIWPGCCEYLDRPDSNPKGTQIMAATSTDALGIGRAVNAPSRRQLGGSMLAAVCSAAFAGAVVLPDRGEAFPAPASPDAELIATAKAPNTEPETSLCP